MFYRKQKISGKENMLCDNYIIIAKHLQFLFYWILYKESFSHYLKNIRPFLVFAVIMYFLLLIDLKSIFHYLYLHATITHILSSHSWSSGNQLHYKVYGVRYFFSFLLTFLFTHIIFYTKKRPLRNAEVF